MKKVLYRKYRPLTFDDVVGQEIVVRTLQNAISINEISHAYIFSGPKGTGKTSLARIFARTLNCANEEVDCCNNCESCNDRDSMDIIEMDAASNNGVDEVREIRDKLTLLPLKSKYKIYIIDEVHMMTTGAFNALLKSIEEPPEHVVFILATTEFYKIPETIKSRCQIMNFNTITDIDVVNRLSYICEKEEVIVENGVLEELATTASGSLRDAISNLDLLKTFSNYNIKNEDVLFFNSSLSVAEIRNLAAELAKRGKGVENFLDKINTQNLNVFLIIEKLLLEVRRLFLKKSDNRYYEVFIFLNNLYNLMSKSSFPTLLLQVEIKNYVETKTTKIDDEDASVEFTSPIELITKTDGASLFKEDLIDCKKVAEVIMEPNEANNNVEILKQIQEVRINNLFTNVSKKTLSEVQAGHQKVREYMITDEYKFYANLLLSGQIVAASKNFCSFVFGAVDKTNAFNSNLKKLDELFSRIIGWEIKVIAFSEESWEIKRNEYKRSKGSYVYDDSEQKLFEIFKMMNIVDKNDIEIEFNDIINYN